MSTPIDDLLDRMHALREEIEVELQKKRDEIGLIMEDQRGRFAADIRRRHLLHKVGLLEYLRGSRWPVMLTAPLIYSGFVVFALLDLFVTVYQATCFPLYGIPRTRRADYLVFDRGDLAYLNPIERFNCFYCSYANGVIALAREVAARTEQYWCPIKHARRLLGAHDRYPRFLEFGDAESYRQGIERLRRDYARDGGA